MFKAVCGEAKSVDTVSSDMTDGTCCLMDILKSYSPNEIYNANETGLIFKLTPDKILEFKNFSVGVAKGERRINPNGLCEHVWD